MEAAKLHKLLKTRKSREFVRELAARLDLHGVLRIAPLESAEAWEIELGEGAGAAPAGDLSHTASDLSLHFHGRCAGFDRFAALCLAVENHLQTAAQLADVSAHSLDKYRELSLLYRLGESLKGIDSRQALVDTAFHLLSSRVASRFFFAALVDPCSKEWGVMQPQGQTGFEERGFRHQRLAELLVDSAPSIHNDPAVCASLWQPPEVPIASMALVPLLRGEEVLGALLLGRDAHAPLYTSEELHLATTLSFLIGGKLTDMNLLDQMLNEQEHAYLEAMQSLAKALEAKDAYTARHSQRVAAFAVMLGKQIGMGEAELALLRQGALMHDLGKIGVPDAILNKPGRLNDHEYEVMRSHALHTAAIMRPLRRFREFTEIAAWHHERWDGNGYPDGLRGEEIPLAARIVAIADSWDAMTDDRIYRKGMPVDKALAILERERTGGQWDPNLLAVFIEMIRQMQAVRHALLEDMFPASASGAFDVAR